MYGLVCYFYWYEVNIVEGLFCCLVIGIKYGFKIFNFNIYQYWYKQYKYLSCCCNRLYGNLYINFINL